MSWRASIPYNYINLQIIEDLPLEGICGGETTIQWDANLMFHQFVANFCLHLFHSLSSKRVYFCSHFVVITVVSRPENRKDWPERCVRVCESVCQVCVSVRTGIYRAYEPFGRWRTVKQTHYTIILFALISIFCVSRSVIRWTLILISTWQNSLRQRPIIGHLNHH